MSTASPVTDHSSSDPATQRSIAASTSHSSRGFPGAEALPAAVPAGSREAV